MSKVKAFFVKKGVRISAKRYFVDAMGAMALGLFATLLIGTIFETLGQYTGWALLTEVAGYASLNTKLRPLIAAAGLEGTAKLLAPVLTEQFVAHPQVLSQLDSFSVLRMINLITGTLGLPVTKEILLELNAELNKVPVEG